MGYVVRLRQIRAYNKVLIWSLINNNNSPV
ncbi:hypothetical protein MAQ5080_01099 [Marinomonas aquimarina]|uniref:Uncharacterized protein n=1 Tax=Marinomonas aquimarina TaxID=295068 RepID=A0A1A8T7D1_9GAMM|nr:hypothetical protein MAQ5080_01099 [Marinomonas aquimarina]